MDEASDLPRARGDAPQKRFRSGVRVRFRKSAHLPDQCATRRVAIGATSIVGRQQLELVHSDLEGNVSTAPMA